MAQDFSDDLLAGVLLVQGQLQSDNYAPGLSGWALFKNGNFEANSGTFRVTLLAGDTIINANGIVIYSGTPNVNDMAASFAPATFTDDFTNDVLGGNVLYGNTPDLNRQAIQGIGTSLAQLWTAPSQTGPWTAQTARITLEKVTPANYYRVAIAGNTLDLVGPIEGAITTTDPVAGAPTSETWHNITLDAGWATTGSAVPQYRMTLENDLKCTGRASQTAWAGGKALNSGNPIPPAYRPKYQTDFYSSDAVGNRAHISIGTNGVFTATLPAGATGTWNAEINGLIPLNPN